jgi:hypothetical protein
MRKVMLSLWVFGLVVKDVLAWQLTCIQRKLNALLSAVVIECRLYWQYHSSRLLG